MITLALVLASLFSSNSHAWGDLGHRMIAENAALLVADHPKFAHWGAILVRHRYSLGVYSTFPDVLFRYQDTSPSKIEEPTHFLDIDTLLGPPRPGHASYSTEELAAIPRDWETFRKKYLEKFGEKRFQAVGSAPWRVEQFMEQAWLALKDVKQVSGGFQSSVKAKGDSAKIYQGLYELGLMSHYSGDMAMPYHSTEDWNGWKIGQGGVHFYTESDCVNSWEPGIALDALKEARTHGAEWLKKWDGENETPAGLVLRLTADSFAEAKTLSALDKEKAVLKPSDQEKKVFAQRRPPKLGCPAMRALLTRRIAKASVLTAALWERVLASSTPDFSKAEGFALSDLEITRPYPAPQYAPISFGTPTGR